jgi:hypothetical protein
MSGSDGPVPILACVMSKDKLGVAQDDSLSWTTTAIDLVGLTPYLLYSTPETPPFTIAFAITSNSYVVTRDAYISRLNLLTSRSGKGDSSRLRCG